MHMASSTFDERKTYRHNAKDYRLIQCNSREDKSILSQVSHSGKRTDVDASSLGL